MFTLKAWPDQSAEQPSGTTFGRDMSAASCLNIYTHSTYFHIMGEVGAMHPAVLEIRMTMATYLQEGQRSRIKFRGET